MRPDYSQTNATWQCACTCLCLNARVGEDTGDTLLVPSEAQWWNCDASYPSTALEGTWNQPQHVHQVHLGWGSRLFFANAESGPPKGKAEVSALSQSPQIGMRTPALEAWGLHSSHWQVLPPGHLSTSGSTRKGQFLQHSLLDPGAPKQGTLSPVLELDTEQSLRKSMAVIHGNYHFLKA